MMQNSIELCRICSKEYTSMHVEYSSGNIIYVCPHCMEESKDNFIWLCLCCGHVYLRPKKQVLARLEHSGLANAALLGEGQQLFLGIDMCIVCNPEGVVEYLKGVEENMDLEVAVG